MQTDRVISSIPEFHAFVEEHWNGHFVYRGEPLNTFDLLSGFGRAMRSDNTCTGLTEMGSFKEFKRLGRLYLEANPQDDWDWISIAQHQGLQTRLLDWTSNPLVAAYFAVKNHIVSDGAIYVFNIADLTLPDFSKSPFGITANHLFRPKHLSRRVAAQSGYFTIHHQPENVFDLPTLEKVTISSELKGNMWVTLGIYNINEFSMFPDLSGLARDITERYLGPKFR